MDTLNSDVAKLAKFMQRHPRLVVLTGAGISIDSGIPAYRNVAGKWQSAQPIQAKDFLQSQETRKRYWTRSFYGWPTVRDARPNIAHLALATLEKAGFIQLLVTQNVDGLHAKAGSRNCVELHGRIDRVTCLDCSADIARESVQHSLANQQNWPEKIAHETRPDGDSDVANELVRKCREPRCPTCGGTLSPDVVFFGGSIPRHRVQRCQLGVQQADALLVVGSSLQVFSGYRLCRQAAREGKAIALINPGDSRADALAQLKLRSAAAPLLHAVSETLQPTADGNHSAYPAFD